MELSFLEPWQIDGLRNRIEEQESAFYLQMYKDMDSRFLIEAEGFTLLKRKHLRESVRVARTILFELVEEYGIETTLEKHGQQIKTFLELFCEKLAKERPLGLDQQDIGRVKTDEAGGAVEVWFHQREKKRQMETAARKMQMTEQLVALRRTTRQAIRLGMVVGIVSGLITGAATGFVTAWMERVFAMKP